MQISELTQMTREAVAIFDQLVGRWDAAVMVTELAAEVGTLADSVMIAEGHRPPRSEESIDLEDDIADVLFMVVRIADHYGIDLAESYQRMIDECREKLEKCIAEQTRIDT